MGDALLHLVQRELDRISCGPSLPFAVSIGATLPAEQLFELRCTLPVRDRDGQYDRTLMRLRNVRIDRALVAAAEGRLATFVVAEVMKLLRAALMHELDENVRADGRLVRDPHGAHP